MRLFRIGLFSRFFALFGVATILLALSFTAAYFVMNEDDALNIVKQRHDSLVTFFSSIESKPLDEHQIQIYAEEIKGDILIEQSGSRYTNNNDFPESTVLLETAQPSGKLLYAKYQHRYYLLYKLPNGWIAFTSTPYNLMVYSDIIVYWPWFLALTILCCSYLILRRWLKPLMDAIVTVKKISLGDFTQLIEQHSNNELADLTKGINKMAAEIKKMFDAKNELLLAISHELRTPLARMKISLAMLEQSHYSNDIEQDLEQMNLLIEQLLEGERLQAGHKALHITSLYLPVFIDEVLNEDTAFERVELNTPIPEAVLNVDVGRFKFLIRNLTNNAIKHNSNDTRIQLNITENSNSLIIKVSDSGNGIPESALPHLFEPFYCADNTSHRNTKGTGLGLYLCQSIVKAHEGTIEVTSTQGKGSCFTIKLPHSLT